MLKSLKIENYALIRSEFLEFENGFTVICGQTGAGKSMILQALGLCLGQRADKDVLFDKDKKCVCELVFSLQEDKRQLFEDNDLDFENETVFRREILPSGKSRAFVNDTPVQLSQMKEMADYLIDIHSQHSVLDIGNKDFQFSVVDAFLQNGVSSKQNGVSGGQNAVLLQQYGVLFRSYKEDLSQLSQVEKSLEELQKDNAYTTYVYEELQKANLQAGEQTSGEQRLELMESAEEVRENISECLSLFEREDYPAILPNLLQVKNLIDKASRTSEKMKELAERTESSLIELKDIFSDLQDFAESINFDAESLQTLRERLELIYDLERKHSVSSVEELLQLQEKFSQSLSSTEQLTERKAELEKQIVSKEKELWDLANEIFAQRTQAAKLVEQGVKQILEHVGMQSAVLKINISQSTDLDQNAACKIEYLFNANKGGEERLKQVEKTASGGELSRLMLAIKTLLSERRNLPAIVFDEIDSGISGETASKVADIMHRISKNTQVIAITHLPQTAAKADFQFKVSKNEVNDKTETKVELLSFEQRVWEIATLLSCGKPTEAALANAQELLAHKIKQ